MLTEPIPKNCNACEKPLLLKNVYCDDGCPCNSPRGVNFKPKPCSVCGENVCVKLGHRIEELGTQAIRHHESLEPLKAVGEAARLIADARKRVGPPANPPTKLWSALINMWDHLDTLQQAIAAGEYD